ncbi:MAG: ABC transporter permease, partial [Firmicutes bacterium]|nr:ABC transporter permease [Bacillota bacterium]
LPAFTSLVYLFLYAPILVLIIFSFNTSRLNATWQGFTLAWYGKLFQDHVILEATRNSLWVAFISTLVSTALGTATALGMHRFRFWGKAAVEALLYIPIVIPEIVMGVSLLAFYVLIGLRLGLTTIVIAHIAFSISFVVVVVRARLHGFDHSLEEAAMDLGANPWATFRRVTLPLIMPGVAAGGMMAFTLSLDDFIITFFAAGPGSTTLPLRIYSMVKTAVTPEVNALSTVILIFTLTLIILAERLQSSVTRGGGGPPG